MKKKRRIFPFYFCMIFVMIFSQAINIYGLNESAAIPLGAEDLSSYVTMDLDKTNAGVGDIIKASVRINQIDNFLGCQINIKYDPSVLQAVNPITGEAFTEVTPPVTGNILVNEKYIPYYYLVTNDLNKGTLYFARMYSNISEYIEGGKPETTGIIAEIGFKVISSNVSSTSIRFEDTPFMTDPISGTILFDYDFVTNKYYTVNQAPAITIFTDSPTPTVSSKYKISGYIAPDFKIGASQSADIKGGFNVEVLGTSFSAQTDTNGFFEIANIPFSTQGYSLKISKDCYLYRIINDVAVSKDVQIASAEAPLTMWAGDMKINGVQDNAINMIDITEVAKGFNSLASEETYNVNSDINRDKAINLIDILILAKHFNNTVNNYPNL